MLSTPLLLTLLLCLTLLPAAPLRLPRPTSRRSALTFVATAGATAVVGPRAAEAAGAPPSKEELDRIKTVSFGGEWERGVSARAVGIEGERVREG